MAILERKYKVASRFDIAQSVFTSLIMTLHSMIAINKEHKFSYKSKTGSQKLSSVATLPDVFLKLDISIH